MRQRYRARRGLAQGSAVEVRTSTPATYLGEDVALGLDVVDLTAPHHLALLQLLHGEDLTSSPLATNTHLHAGQDMSWDGHKPANVSCLRLA